MVGLTRVVPSQVTVHASKVQEFFNLLAVTTTHVSPKPWVIPGCWKVWTMYRLHTRLRQPEPGLMRTIYSLVLRRKALMPFVVALTGDGMGMKIE